MLNMDTMTFEPQRITCKSWLEFKTRIARRKKKKYALIFKHQLLTSAGTRRAQFIHEEFRQSGFVSAIQRFDMDTIGHNTVRRGENKIIDSWMS